jgi:hypothetical protein
VEELAKVFDGHSHGDRPGLLVWYMEELAEHIHLRLGLAEAEGPHTADAG